jgi:ABC-type branched-subunit amino acid transport system permease subunit
MDELTKSTMYGLAAALVMLGVAAFAAGAVLARERRFAGRQVHSEKPGRARRALAVTAAAVAFAIIVVDARDGQAALAIAVLALAAALFAFAPSLHDSVLGENGVRGGWHVRSFAELEEWRLTGDHLRWKLHGEWQACRVPRERFAELRQRLSELCPARESAFKD